MQYDTHNLYSLSEARSTYEALVAVTNRRPFILTRW
jgi:alpha-glucosidase (family GH31 glycosyl hydrolase)